VIESQPVEYRCRCSRDGLLEKLGTLAASDIEELLDDNGECEAVCAFCNTSYVYSADELTAAN
jgi:molecular chaperone Hsp33